MSMYNVRLQVLIDEMRSRRLDAEAARRGVSVATLVREGIDLVLPQGPSLEERQAAAQRFLSSPKIEVPHDPDALRAYIGTMYDEVMPDA